MMRNGAGSDNGNKVETDDGRIMFLRTSAYPCINGFLSRNAAAYRRNNYGFYRKRSPAGYQLPYCFFSRTISGKAVVAGTLFRNGFEEHTIKK
ncbi:hypothetical protein QTP88_003726 [Uroleucon formosanum]